MTNSLMGLTDYTSACGGWEVMEGFLCDVLMRPIIGCHCVLLILVKA